MLHTLPPATPQITPPLDSLYQPNRPIAWVSAPRKPSIKGFLFYPLRPLAAAFLDTILRGYFFKQQLSFVYVKK